MDLAALHAVREAHAIPEADAWAVLGPLIDALPRAWCTIRTGEDGAAFSHQDGRNVIVSVARESDGKRWLHASISRMGKMPTYDDLCEMKRLFVGRTRKAVEVFAPEAEHVNLHPTCRHLWACLDGDPLPDFTRGTGSI